MRKDSAEVESALLASIVLLTDAQDKALPKLTDNDFTTEFHTKVFRTMVKMYEAGEPIDQVSVRRKAKAKAVEFAEMMDSCPVPSNWSYYLRSVKTDAKKRHQMNVLTAALADTQAGDVDQAKAMVETVLEPDDEDLGHVYLPDALFGEALTIVEAAAQGEAAILGHPSGWPTLDRYIGGLVPGNFVIIAGRPGQGKSAVATNMAVNLAKRSTKVLLFSLEMTAQEVAMRMVCREAKVGWQVLRSGNGTPENYTALTEAHDRLSRLPLVVVDSGDVTITHIRSLVRQYDPDVVIVDYIQLMGSPGKESRQQEVAAISRSLKVLAKDQGFCMVGLAQLNRNIEMRGGAGASPLLSDLRDSGTLEQDADIVIFVAPRNGTDLELIVAKNRNGQVSTNGEVTLKWTRGIVDIEDPLQAAPHLRAVGS